nr:MAG TPA: hypothetical protein [Caudoviricetes sp.]
MERAFFINFFIFITSLLWLYYTVHSINCQYFFENFLLI